MDELDFSKPGKPAAPPPPQAPVINLAAALEFFRTAGKAETVAAGALIFSEKEKAGLFKSDKMYLLMEGEVALSAGGKPIGTVKAGEIFGEMAAISDSPRSATATARAACRLIGLDDKGFHAALKEKPEFALTLLGMMTFRLRNMLARLARTGALAGAQAGKEKRVFDKTLLAALAQGLGDANTVHFERDKPIMREGSAGAVMYVVLEGRVAVSIKGNVVERVPPGGVFGEMALVDQSPRAATAMAETDCLLLTLNRGVFLQLVKTQPEFGVALLAAAAERVRFMASR